MKNKILSLLRESSGYMSGEEISKRLDVSRTAIWKHINHLREEGYLIESSSKKGYMLVKSPDVLSYEEIRRLLNTKYMGRNIAYYETVTSTNDLAKKAALSGESEGFTVIAEYQTAGRGRMGRHWNTHGGDSIAMSVILRPKISPQYAPSLTSVLAVATAEAIKKETGINVGIKWPNDITIDGKKLCGILTEMSAEPDIVNYIVAGIGINVGQEHFEEEIGNIAASLKMVSGRSYERKKLLSSILNIFEVYYELFKKEGLTPLISKLKGYSVLIGREVCIEDMRGVIKGTAVDIDSDGSLLVKKDNGETVKIYSGDVTTKGFYRV